MRMIYRAFCPACQWFIESPLLEIMRTEDYRNIIDLTLIPAAGMRVKKDGKITCEGGMLECTGHRWMICVLDKDRDDVVKYLGTIACIEGDESGQVGDWSTKMNNCVTDKERVVVEECFENRSKDLLVKLIQQELSGNLPWMPYTLVNQKALGTATEGISLNMLKTSICSAYTGPKSFYPAECVKFVGEQKLFAAEDTVENKGGKVEMATVLWKQPLSHFVSVLRLECQIRCGWNYIGEHSALAVCHLSRNHCSRLFQEIIDFHPVPAAGTYYDAEGNVHCAAGRVECAGHKWLSCVVDEFQQMGELVEYIACMESKDNKGMTWSFVINRCFKSEALTKMKTCYKSKSEELLRKNVVKKQALRIPWVPYVLLNGVPLGDARHGIGFQQLMDAVCKAYSGPLSLWPTPCQPKRLRDEAQLMPPG
ncbi:unnamed protein product [Peronospora belbahrii]|uniref:Uncharacterized protein n=1 Tax=Peronospora belbahrii TaxID=622444 RepID=A0AAU9KM54_9STRA|nr:unnamed protein product [Peronospora belbahrii]